MAATLDRADQVNWAYRTVQRGRSLVLYPSQFTKLLPSKHPRHESGNPQRSSIIFLLPLAFYPWDYLPAIILRDKRISACIRDEIRFKVDSLYSQAQAFKSLQRPAPSSRGCLCINPTVHLGRLPPAVQGSISPDWIEPGCLRKEAGPSSLPENQVVTFHPQAWKSRARPSHTGCVSNFWMNEGADDSYKKANQNFECWFVAHQSD